ncbi:MAG: hypothetical protein COB22_08910 [Cycloclasticus sp.]|nr:MAG: hypothetical protein COB22_08910 [Cycloclasticus sp.]
MKFIFFIQTSEFWTPEFEDFSESFQKLLKNFGFYLKFLFFSSEKFNFYQKFYFGFLLCPKKFSKFDTNPRNSYIFSEIIQNWF